MGNYSFELGEGKGFVDYSLSLKEEVAIWKRLAVDGGQMSEWAWETIMVGLQGKWRTSREMIAETLSLSLSLISLISPLPAQHKIFQEIATSL